MKTSDVICKILGEVTGKPESSFRSFLDLIPPREGDKELTDQEAEELLNKLRKEKSGILNWLLKGQQQVIDRGYIEIPESVIKHAWKKTRRN